MKISQIVEILDATVYTGEELLDLDIHTACGSDLLSDVLAFVKDQAVLLTGMVNLQVVRTAEMTDMRCIIFVRGKKPAEDIIELAKEKGVAILGTRQRMYEACGLLYANGLERESGGN